MREASELVLPGFPLKTDAKIVRYPDRYMDPRGEGMWATVMGILEGIEQENPTCVPRRMNMRPQTHRVRPQTHEHASPDAYAPFTY